MISHFSILNSEMIPSFVIPRLLTELILPGFNDYFSRKKRKISYSQITATQEQRRADLIIKIERLTETVFIEIEISDADDYWKKEFESSIREILKESAFILQLISGREIKEISLAGNHKKEDKINPYQITVGLRDDENEILLIITIPGRFFNILIPSLDTSYPQEKITEFLISFFKKPDILYPSIEILLSKLNSGELSGLLDLLKRNNRLSDYQLVLLINGFPEYSLKIKNALSKNRQESLREELKKYKGKINKEDIACGIYSVEEGIFQAFQKEKNYIADHFRIFSSLIKKITDYELYTRKSWQEWIAEMEEKKLLYKTILKCSDQTLLTAFFDYSEEKYPFFKNSFSPARISEIFCGINNRLSGSQAEAGISMIKIYRKLSAEVFRYDHEDFSYIIASVKNNKDFEIIVRNTGWYVLSTALKQCSRKLADRVLSGINYPASELIKGTLSGTINPDIIHDEIQVNRARNESVRVILELYKDGLIELDI